jgi:hypothetical protein
MRLNARFAARIKLREAEHQNDCWQCDHKDLKIWAIDENGKIGKVWITAILDDYSRMIPGYFLTLCHSRRYAFSGPKWAAKSDENGRRNRSNLGDEEPNRRISN